MKFLIETNKFDPSGVSPWLFDDLASELMARGHTVHVIHLDYSCTNPKNIGPSNPNLFYTRFGPKAPTAFKIVKNFRNMKTGLTARRFLKRNFFKKNVQFDVNISSSIALFNWGIPKLVKKLGISDHNVFFLWDFFPIHHFQIGKVSNGIIEKILKKAERIQIEQSDHIYLMSPANIKFLHSYHPGIQGKVHIQPPWGTRADRSEQNKVSVGEIKLIFGGQTGAGRGLEELFQALLIVEDLFPGKIKLHIYTSDIDMARLNQFIVHHDISFVELNEYLPRKDYRKQLDLADFGIAITVPNVSAPTFPSKITDYLASGLPVIAVLEANSDAGELLEFHGAGFSSPSGDVNRLANLLIELIQIKQNTGFEEYKSNAIKLFEKSFNVEQFVGRLIEEVGSRPHD